LPTFSIKAVADLCTLTSSWKDSQLKQKTV